jgi:hypothetical protein
MVPASIIHSPRTSGDQASVVYSSTPLYNKDCDSQEIKSTKDHSHSQSIPIDKIATALRQGKLTISVTSKKLLGTNDINGWWQIFNHTSIAVGDITNQPRSRYQVELLTVLTAIHVLLQAQDSTSIPDIPTCITFEVRQKRVISRVIY